MLYSFFWVIRRRRNFMYRRFGTLCSICVGLSYKKNDWDQTTYEDGTDRVFRKIGTSNSDAGESPQKGKRLFEICTNFRTKMYLLK
jgi:hypothetical protein